VGTLLHSHVSLTCAFTAIGGLHDPRVGYWEPMKYAQVLRDNGAQTVLCNIEMSAGHFSSSGRFDRLKDVALDYAFVLRVLGLEEVVPMV
jgi:oligopeptidase B